MRNIFQMDKSSHSEQRRFLIGRGIAEIFAGPLVAIVDVIATVARMCATDSDPTDGEVEDGCYF